MKIPRRLRAGLSIGLLTIGWFLILPFPFLGGWKWFGGFLIVRQILANETVRFIDYASTASYGSSLDVLAQCVLSLLLAIGVWLLIQKRKRRQKDT